MKIEGLQNEGESYSRLEHAKVPHIPPSITVMIFAVAKREGGHGTAVLLVLDEGDELRAIDHRQSGLGMVFMDDADMG